MTPEEGDRICEAVVALLERIADRTKPPAVDRARVLSPAEHAYIARREGLL